MNNPCIFPRYRELTSSSKDRELLGYYLQAGCDTTPCYENHYEIGEELLHEAEHEGFVVLLNMEEHADKEHPRLVTAPKEAIRDS